MKYNKMEKREFTKSKNRITENLKWKICLLTFYTNSHIVLMIIYVFILMKKINNRLLTALQTNIIGGSHAPHLTWLAVPLLLDIRVLELETPEFKPSSIFEHLTMIYQIFFLSVCHPVTFGIINLIDHWSYIFSFLLPIKHLDE